MPTIPDTLEMSPYIAGLHGKSAADASALEEHIESLPDAVKEFLFDPELPGRLGVVVEETRLPRQFSVALAKLVFMTILGDVPVTAHRQLLERLGIEPLIAGQVAQHLDVIFKPLVAARAQSAAKPLMRPLPPLTTTRPSTPTSPPPPPLSQNASPNVVDLRNKPQA